MHITSSLNLKARISLALLSVLPLFFVGCRCTTQIPQLRIGINPWPGYEPLFLAKVKGFYEKHGLNVEIKEFSSVVDTTSSFRRGEIDLMCGTVVENIQPRLTDDKPMILLMVTDSSNGPDVVLGQKDVVSVAQLRGKKVGVQTGGLGEYMLAAALQKAGLGLSDVRMVGFDQTKMEAAFLNHDVDAAVSYPPFSTNILRKSGTTTLFSSAEIPLEVLDALSIKGEILKEHPEIRSKILDAWQDALDYMKSSPIDATAIMAKRESITPAEYSASLEGLVYLSKADQAPLYPPSNKLLQVIGKIQKALVSAKVIEKESDPLVFLP